MLKLILIFFLIFTNLSYGYIGPGMAGGVLAAALGIVIAIFAGLFAIIYYPIKRIIIKLKHNKKKEDSK